MSFLEKNKRQGVIGTIIFHVIILFSFLFMGLKYQDPPPAEEGISIDFGFIDDGFGEIESENIDEIEKTIEKQVENNDETLSQSIIETTPIKKIEEKKKIIEKKEPEENLIDEKKIEINTKAIYTGKKKKKKKSEGEKRNNGNQGVIDGDNNSDIYTGAGIGSDGSAYQLGTRDAIKKPKPKGNQEEGKVVVIITVNRLGDVTYAKAGAKGTTTFNKELLKRAKKAALETKFSAKQNAPNNQQGKIIYNFRLN